MTQNTTIHPCEVGMLLIHVTIVSGLFLRVRRSLPGPTKKPLRWFSKEALVRPIPKISREARGMRASQPSFGMEMDQISLERLKLRVQLKCLAARVAVPALTVGKPRGASPER